MDARKVLEMGGGTVLISLPKSWAKRNGIVKGDSLLVEEISPNRLIVSPMGREHDSKTAIIGYPRENLSHVINDITGAYLIGNNFIRIEGTQTISREDRDSIKAVLRRLVGLEIMDEDSKSLTLQFLPEPSALDPEKIVRRMGSLTGGMLRDSREALLKGDSKMMALIVERDDEVDRLYFLLVRAIRTATIDPEIAKRYNLTPVECLDYRVLASFLEGLGDTIAEFSGRASEELPGTSAARQISEVLKVLEGMGETSVRIFLGRKSGQGRKGYLEIGAMHQEATALLRKIAQTGSISTRAMLDLLSVLERVSKTYVDVADLSLPTYQFNEEILPETRKASES